jgi:hypothetical protein
MFIESLSGARVGVTNRFDLRECGPLADHELRPSVTEPQGLVARGMLRDTGQGVKVSGPGLQEWVRTRVGQSAAHSGVALAGTAGPALGGVESGRHSQRGNSTAR